MDEPQREKRVDVDAVIPEESPETQGSTIWLGWKEPRARRPRSGPAFGNVPREI
jgi:hypothetical protein